MEDERWMRLLSLWGLDWGLDLLLSAECTVKGEGEGVCLTWYISEGL